MEQAGSLQRRLDAALAPDATSLERDALIYALSRPLPPEASARERADFLLALLEDEQLRALKGSGGRTVGKAATRALLALGYPYALEIPPGAIDPSADAHLVRGGLALGSKVILGNAVAAAAIFTLVALVMGGFRDSWLIPTALLALGAGTVLPLFLVRKGREKKNIALQVMGCAGLGLSSFAVGAISLDMFMSMLSYSGFHRWSDFVGLGFFGSGLLFGIAQLVGTALLYSSGRSTPDERSPRGPERP